MAGLPTNAIDTGGGVYTCQEMQTFASKGYVRLKVRAHTSLPFDTDELYNPKGEYGTVLVTHIEYTTVILDLNPVPLHKSGQQRSVDASDRTCLHHLLQL